MLVDLLGLDCTRLARWDPTVKKDIGLSGRYLHLRMPQDWGLRPPERRDRAASERTTETRGKYSDLLLCRLRLQFPFPRVPSTVAILVASIKVIIHVLPRALLKDDAIVAAVAVTVAAGVAVAGAVVLPAAVAAGSAAVVAILITPATAPFTGAAVIVVAVAVEAVAAAGPPRRWLRRWRRSLWLLCA